jgi:hypothetical protein
LKPNKMESSQRGQQDFERGKFAELPAPREKERLENKDPPVSSRLESLMPPEAKPDRGI